MNDAPALAHPGGPPAVPAERHGRSPGLLALARLLRRSEAVLPIPGTSSVRHPEEDMAAARIALDDEEFDTLSAVA